MTWDIGFVMTPALRLLSLLSAVSPGWRLLTRSSLLRAAFFLVASLPSRFRGSCLQVWGALSDHVRLGVGKQERQGLQQRPGALL